jgi:FlaA1/EpsC-like NDP-sugar epimerase
MGNPIKIYELAQQMIQLAGFTPNVDISIQITGERPGEKLHEALISEQEQVIPTAHPKILAVEDEYTRYLNVSKVMSVLAAAINRGTSAEQLWQTAQQCIEALETSSIKSV